VDRPVQQHRTHRQIKTIIFSSGVLLLHFLQGSFQLLYQGRWAKNFDVGAYAQNVAY
jgi:hypothetical protein